MLTRQDFNRQPLVADDGQAPLAVASSHQAAGGAPGSAPAAPSRRRWTLAAASLALFLVFLDNTVVNVALPSIQHALATSTDALEWSVNAYIVVFAGLIVLGGALGDRVGRKRIFMRGLMLFGAASLGAALASSAGELIAARAVQGVGAALLAALLLPGASERKQRPANAHLNHRTGVEHGC